MSGCPVKHSSTSPSGKPPSSCPVSAEATIESYNEAANDMTFGQERQRDQSIELSKQRSVSTIPKSDFTPAHQPTGNDNWIYPSEQQYYNAMKRKGYDPKEKDVPVILTIHNMVNEQGWTKVKEWEALRSCPSPKLKQFIGRPKDLSPKARFLSLLGYSLPFDRHDWVVDRDGTDVRYVIDFYKGKSTPFAPISIYMDVRPALDSPQALFDRVSVGVRELLGKTTFPPVTRDGGGDRK